MNDLKIAKDIYFQCLGSKFFIDREYGQQYKKFNVPPAIEESWKKELCDILKREIKYNEGCLKIDAVGKYIQLLNANASVEFLNGFLGQTKLDSFSTLILIETLKRYYLHSASYGLSGYSKELILTSIKHYKMNLLSSKITVDQSYKNSPSMRGYDFSEANIISRIKKL